VARADALYGVMARATRGLFEALLEVDRTRAWEGDGARDLAHWVQMRYGVSAWKAHRWADAAAALERLPRLGDALARGEVGVDKVVELTRFATPETEGGLVAWAASVSSGAIRRRADVEVKRPAEASAGLDRERRVRWWLTDEGRRMELFAEPPAYEGSLVAAAIERTANERPDLPDERRDDLVEARRADALVALCAGAAGSAVGRSARRRVRPRVVVHTSVSSLGADGSDGRASELDAEGVPGVDGAVIDLPTPRRLACDADLQLLVSDRAGHPLRLGRRVRQPSRALARAVRRRDRECRFPGCGARRFADAHHIEWWSRGGMTDVENLILLCGFHHRLVHEHGWEVARNADGTLRWIRADGTRYRAGPSPPAVLTPAG
ncbi:MAG TPA: DUF222 domain-containing protein, partial [Actinomycetota bacterium]|nr:DUF222 domain-containing protein [Actinomycetota bacterium]